MIVACSQRLNGTNVVIVWEVGIGEVEAVRQRDEKSPVDGAPPTSRCIPVKFFSIIYKYRITQSFA